MNLKNKKIIWGIVMLALLACLGISFSTINEKKHIDYTKTQVTTDALTHDITTIQQYKSPYIGNASNISQLFYHLPLNHLSMNFEIDSKACALTVNYIDTIKAVGVEEVRRDLLYNTIAAMATIDNLDKITYHFSDATYTFDRTQIETIFGSPLSNLLDKEIWRIKVQEPLKLNEFVQSFFK